MLRIVNYRLSDTTTANAVRITTGSLAAVFVLVVFILLITCINVCCCKGKQEEEERVTDME